MPHRLLLITPSGDSKEDSRADSHNGLRGRKATHSRNHLNLCINSSSLEILNFKKQDISVKGIAEKGRRGFAGNQEGHR
jgi:hypothetical protein